MFDLHEKMLINKKNCFKIFGFDSQIKSNIDINNTFCFYWFLPLKKIIHFGWDMF